MKALKYLHSNYVGDPAAWRIFLSCWLSEMGCEYALPTGFQDDSIELIGRRPPKSYADFVLATGGKGFLSPLDMALNSDSSLAFFQIDMVGLFKEKDPDSWRIWCDYDGYLSYEEYCDYSSSQKVGWRSGMGVDNLVLVGDLWNGIVLLLNPLEVTSDGEWEAWYLSGRLPGALRFKSFAEMMVAIFFSEINRSSYFGFVDDVDFENSSARGLLTKFRK